METMGLELVCVNRTARNTPRNYAISELMFSHRGVQIFEELAPKFSSFHLFTREVREQNDVVVYYLRRRQHNKPTNTAVRIKTPYQALGMTTEVQSSLRLRKLPVLTLQESPVGAASKTRPLADFFVGDTFTHVLSELKAVSALYDNVTLSLVDEFEFKLLMLSGVTAW